MFTGPIDGRRRRAQDSRERLVAAVLVLVEDGNVSPRAEEVAAAAEVGLRTVFRHFKDMESLYAEMLLVVSGRYHVMAAPFVAVDWAGQLVEMCGRRWTTYETLMPFKRAADVHRHASVLLQANYSKVLATLRARLDGVLPGEIVGDPARLEAVDLLLSFDAWMRLRGDQGLDAAVAREVLRGQLRGALGGKWGDLFDAAYDRER